MNRETEAVYLAESLEELERALDHLRYSAKATAGISGNLAGVTEDELAQVEAFTSRFARVVDIVTKRVLRALDRVEWYDAGTLLDVANRAEKRGLIDSVDWLRELKDTRNRISHDYAGQRLSEILVYCREELNRLLDTCDRIKKYSVTPQ